MRGFWGLMWAYWFSEKWQEAWGLAAVIVVLTALSAMASVWFAEASGELVSAIAFLHHPQNPTTLSSILTIAATLATIMVLKSIGFTAVRHFFSTTLHRKWRAWLDQRFNDALLGRNHTHLHLQRGVAEAIPTSVGVPDNIDQRIQESIKGMTGGAIGLAMGVAGVTLSLYFVGGRIIETSTEVSGLEFLGSYGSAFLTLFAVAAYVPLNTYIAVKLGAIQQRLDVRMQWAEGSYRRELTTLLHRSFHIAASHGERVQKRIHRRRYRDIDQTWSNLNILTACYLGFELVYNFFGQRIVAYAPGLLPYVEGKVTLQGYVTGAELANAIINDCSWFIHVMPDIARLRANARRVTDLANAIEDVQQPRAFYARTGHAELHRVSQDPEFGLTIRRLELMHPGQDLPFITTGFLHVSPGEWALLVGKSGSGKSSLLKAINGLWPHGRGTVALPRNVRTLFAAQDVKLPPISLKELICLPEPGEAFTDRRAAVALSRAGLAEFAGDLAEEGRGTQSWDQLLSGGQKQKLVLARILLQRPGLLFLDEPTSALDGEATLAFHQAIKDACPGATVISIMHDAVPPKSLKGEEFYDSVLAIADGRVTKRSLSKLPVGPIGPARIKPRAETMEPGPT
ncbi:Zinc carboxypeptidase A metalloprotease (plasmid) [Sinorhizobium sojae CCBAU 05684]|uniref:Zinc carboxypeptidase A metalloprotease n=1 Tax=Sinorhizobium sojae CCBAU 05684 TaxID=716928 RepID=A0A249PHN3_9HYPH|nr:ABC transporter ATP-binding protein/permease [Sinorhizobium sojae]ASY65252.1 Zinc carboxypeptidase A metalloprotease [Sinorhizobium sojae CCBAU 05684]